MMKKKIIIFASGAGSNAKAIIEHSKKNASYEVSHIITDQKDAGVITWAKHFEIPISIIPFFSYDTKKTHEERIIRLIQDLSFNLIVLAGYQRVFTNYFLCFFPKNSIVNIHPSLLPMFKGQNAIKKSWENKESKVGVTIHYVDEGVDTGEIIKQKEISINSELTLSEFEELIHITEHQIYPEAIVELLNSGRIYRVNLISKNKNKIEKYNSVIFMMNCPCSDLYFFAKKYLCDELLNYVSVSQFDTSKILDENKCTVSNFTEITYKTGITNNKINALWSVLNLLPFYKSCVESINTVKVFLNLDEDNVKVKEVFNPWTEELRFFTIDEYNKNDKNLVLYFKGIDEDVIRSTGAFCDIEILESDIEVLQRTNNDKFWSLSRDELVHVKKYFESLKRNPTDVEMDIIAQTWSEHCKHKIFNASIIHNEENNPLNCNSLFKTYIVGATKKIIQENKIDWTRSVFTDNAGIVRWDSYFDVCIKVETHNSPSALDPYAGALTGILGVNRDILGCGIGGKPIANTSVFCLPNVSEYDRSNWPSNIIDPLILRQGIHQGVKDGGNKTGIPTVNGSFSYHSSYSAKPLVFCGTVGIIPRSINEVMSHEKNQVPGDLIVMIGGKVGKDGVHGATFSSVENDGTFPSSVVQMGDPMTQKRMTDFLLAARDQSLYSSITDNGAGGLSSSIGEMCIITNGAHIDAEKIPLKYLGIRLNEIIISESQERMSCSVSKKNIVQFIELSKEFNVEATVIGEFNNSGFLSVSYNNAIAANLSLSFLHESLPQLRLNSCWNKDAWSILQQNDNSKKLYKKNILQRFDLKSKVESLLKHLNITSHQKFVQQYDHEVQASNCMKQFSLSNGPSDASVIKMNSYGSIGENGIVISSGLMNLSKCHDPKLLAYYAVDEAIRNSLCVGVDLKKSALVDNFCWPNPVTFDNDIDAHYKLGALVKTCQGLYEITTKLCIPLISGKDSMKNDSYYLSEQNKIKLSITPTLLMTLIGHKENVYKKLTPCFSPGEDLWLLKPQQVLKMVTLGDILGKNILFDDHPSLSKLFENYKSFSELIAEGIINSAHDVSEGGALISIIEMAINSNCGVDVNLSTEEQYFGEGMGMIIFSSSKNNRTRIKSKLIDAQRIGIVRIDGKIYLPNSDLIVEECKSWFLQGV